MKYSQFKDKQISMLGFGAMRLPTVTRNGEKVIDEEMTERLLDRAIAGGVNYFDTAYPYHGGNSERILGKLLSKYPRESYYLADKYPGHQIMEKYEPAKIFEEQLEKCNTDYFDFYLLHNVYENSMPTYLDQRWGIIEYFLEQKRLGRIGHLGFSSHGSPENLREFLRLTDGKMEFCQIQLNYLDYTLQRASEKCEILREAGVPIWVMEPVRGGKLANLTSSAAEKLKSLRPDESSAAWGFRWLQGIEGVTVILSGMSAMEQVEDNVRTFSGGSPLTSSECELLLDLAEGMKRSAPCTACRYCTDGCPAGLDIPALIEIYNDLSCVKSLNTAMRVEFLPDDKKPSACISCGKCKRICPQGIDIPKLMSDLCEILESIPSWRDVSRERAEAAERVRAEAKKDKT